MTEIVTGKWIKIHTKNAICGVSLPLGSPARALVRIGLRIGQTRLKSGNARHPCARRTATRSAAATHTILFEQTEEQTSTAHPLSVKPLHAWQQSSLRRPTVSECSEGFRCSIGHMCSPDALWWIPVESVGSAHIRCANTRQKRRPLCSASSAEKRKSGQFYLP